MQEAIQDLCNLDAATFFHFLGAPIVWILKMFPIVVQYPSATLWAYLGGQTQSSIGKGL